MKKFLVVLLSSVLLLSACAKNTEADVSTDAGISRYSETPNDSEDLIFPTLYVRTDNHDGNASGDYPIITIIKTRAELEKYTSDNEKTYDFATTTHSICFYDAATKYDENYFKDNALVMLVLREDSSSYTHSNKGFSKTDNGYNINMIRFTREQEEKSTAYWHIIFEVPQTSPVLEAELTVSFTDQAVNS